VNEDQMAELEVRPGEELERTLERYARLRLGPSTAEAKRARTAVMEAAWRQRIAGPARAADPTATRSTAAARRRTRHGLFASWGPRRLGASLAAAVLAGLLVGSTAFAASRAGGPLYGVRMTVEELTLPADASARLEAELALAQGRLAEIVDAVARGDEDAVEAAVDGYLAALGYLEGVSGAPADRAESAVAFHRAILLEVLERVPDDARSGIEHALASSSKVIDRLDAAGTTPDRPAAGPGIGGGASGPGGGTQGGGNGGTQGGSGSQGEKPSKEPAPAKTPVADGPEEPRPSKPPKPATKPDTQGAVGENAQGDQP
jgi:uncharacterized membrane protein YgcG